MSDQKLETNDSSDSSVNSTANNRKQYYCHLCNNNIEPLFAPGLTCPRCNGGFVEEVEENSDLREFVEHGGGGQDTDDDYDDIQIPLPENPPNGLNEILQLIQNMINGPLRVQTESRDGTTTTTITATGTRTTTSTTENADQQNDGLNQQQPNIIFMDASAQNTGDNRTSPPFNLARMFRALESGTNAVNFMNILNIAGDPGDYAWGNTGWDNIISQLMEQQAGRQAPPPATDEIIANLPKTKITKKQVVEEQLGCPVCKDEFKIDEEAVYLPCTHTFHYDCIKPWLKMNGTCPVCRYSLVNQDNNEQNHNGQNRNNSAGSSGNNNNNFGSSTSMFRFSFNSSLPGTYPGNQQNNEQQNHQGETHDADLDHEPVD